MDTWTYLRMSRANPPGLATKDEARRFTYSAALQQAEELLMAARSSGWASRPLPLFYALSQAARAVAAAAAEKDWELRGHGLKTDFRPDPMDSLVIPGDSGSFPRICQLVGSNLSVPVSLTEVWAAIPALAETPGPPDVPRPLLVERIQEEYPFSAMPGPVKATVVFPADIETKDRHDELLSAYPAAAHAQVTMETRETAVGFGRVIAWPGHMTSTERFYRFDELVSFDPATGHRWLLPGIGASKDLLHPLLHWWVLLFGFSMLARYEPRRWRELLDVDGSPWAVAVEDALDVGIEALPELLLSVLSLTGT